MPCEGNVDSGLRSMSYESNVEFDLWSVPRESNVQSSLRSVSCESNVYSGLRSVSCESNVESGLRSVSCESNVESDPMGFCMECVLTIQTLHKMGWPQLPRGQRRRSAAARLLRLWVRIHPVA